jgi:hypothetical protein
MRWRLLQLGDQGMAPRSPARLKESRVGDAIATAAAAEDSFNQPAVDQSQCSWCGLLS